MTRDELAWAPERGGLARPVVTLDQLALDPTLATALSPAEALRLFRAGSIALAAITAQLIAGRDHEAASTPQALLTLADVAKALGIPESKAYELARRGELPTVAIPGGKYTRVDPADLADWIDKRKLPLVTSARDDRRRVSAAPRTARPQSG